MLKTGSLPQFRGGLRRFSGKSGGAPHVVAARRAERKMQNVFRLRQVQTTASQPLTL
jgi:hypothetical protein